MVSVSLNNSFSCIEVSEEVGSIYSLDQLWLYNICNKALRHGVWNKTEVEVFFLFLFRRLLEIFLKKLCSLESHRISH